MISRLICGILPRLLSMSHGYGAGGDINQLPYLAPAMSPFGGGGGIVKICELLVQWWVGALVRLQISYRFCGRLGRRPL